SKVAVAVRPTLAETFTPTVTSTVRVVPPQLGQAPSGVWTPFAGPKLNPQAPQRTGEPSGRLSCAALTYQPCQGSPEHSSHGVQRLPLRLVQVGTSAHMP